MVRLVPCVRVLILVCNRGITVGNDLHVSKFRFNHTFHQVNADEFLKNLLNSKEVQANFPPIGGVGDVSNISFKALNCTVLNMTYFDFLCDIDLVNRNTGSIRGAYDEWQDGMQLGDRLRQALVWEEDE